MKRWIPTLLLILLLSGCTAAPLIEETSALMPAPSVVSEGELPDGDIQIALIMAYMGPNCAGTDGGLSLYGKVVRLQKLELAYDGAAVVGVVEYINDGYVNTGTYYHCYTAKVRGVVGVSDDGPYVESLTYEPQSGGVGLYISAVEEAATNDRKQVQARRAYDLPMLDTADRAVNEQINAFFQQDCERFMADDGFWESVEGRYRYDVTEMPYILHPLHDTMTAKPVYMDAELLSVEQTSCWNAGGMNYTSYYGNTFDLHTGERLALDYFVKEEIEVFNAWVTRQVLEEDSGLFTEEKINGMFRECTFADYQYAYNGGEVMIYLDEPRITGSAPVLRYQISEDQ